ncbi:Oidioi.mRNA.OKI2018_I69.chr2.g4919.t1.cds [Oikopleura dioica]|uniref:Histidine ammonia-lyase n=1 Tax=Oikopleura dioica TaxID=34765 RepID=A0ABN7T0E9_OIKDI|nr:Oidioi.mRNA.OKI2018_I69.chr2.g4919.t1.cds [Oikopleura dioica]
METVLLNGNDLTPETLKSLQSFESKIDLSESAWEAVRSARKVIDKVLDEKRTVYGINTGFGKFCRVLVEPERLVELQNNLITSHACGVGECIPVGQARGLMALRINILAKGFSGISEETISRMIKAFNSGVVSQVPARGTVGASGDLAPLAHIALGLLGYGKMYSPKTGIAPAEEVLTANNVSKLELKPKEGLALINGTQFISTIGSEALVRAENLRKSADIIAAMTIDTLSGKVYAFDDTIRKAKKHKGQSIIASNLRSLLGRGSARSRRNSFSDDHTNYQDPYTFRCVPTVHGIALDSIKFVRSILAVELNSATDNPMILAKRDRTISCGNFHGEYPAKALDILAIAVQDIANISERRIERLCNPSCSGLPAFLAPEGGINSGFMMSHVTASALVSENKVLCHPSSTDSLSTSAGTEDHVSMGGWAARKALQVVKNAEHVLGIELLAACQAFDLKEKDGQFSSTETLTNVRDLVREHITFMDRDRYLSDDMEKATELIVSGKIAELASFIQ